MATNYLKPQSPLKKIDKKTGDINYMYPMTTPDQIVMEDGRRLNAVLDELSENTPNIDLNDVVYFGADDAEDTTTGTTALTDADTLGGYAASHFASKEELTNIVNGTTKVGKATQADSATSAAKADSATKATQDGSGNTITSTYATKAQLGTQVTYSLSGTTLTITTK